MEKMFRKFVSAVACIMLATVLASTAFAASSDVVKVVTKPKKDQFICIQDSSMKNSYSSAYSIISDYLNDFCKNNKTDVPENVSVNGNSKVIEKINETDYPNIILASELNGFNANKLNKSSNMNLVIFVPYYYDNEENIKLVEDAVYGILDRWTNSNVFVNYFDNTIVYYSNAKDPIVYEQ